MNTVKLTTILYAIVSLAGNGTIFLIVPPEYKIYLLFAFNLIQVVLALIDPTYTLKKLGMTKQEYLGRVK